MITYRKAGMWGKMVLFLLVAAILAACGGGAETGGSGDAAEQSEGKTVTVEMQNFKFVPDEIRINVGDTVEFVNLDQIAHDVVQATAATLDTDDVGFESPQISGGDSWSHTFTEAGEYPILCTVGSHYLLGMTATVVVE